MINGTYTCVKGSSATRHTVVECGLIQPGPPDVKAARMDSVIVRVAEGLCPEGHGDLWRVPLRPSPAADDTDGEAGWCGMCRRAYVARRHRHTEVCAGPNIDEAHLFCAYDVGEPTIAWYPPEALLYEVPTPRLPEDIRCQLIS